MAAERPAARGRLRDATGSIRVRTTAAATGIVGLALLLGAVALVIVMRTTLTNEVLTAARLRASEIAAMVESGQALDGVAVGDPEELAVQVIDADGEVVGATPNIAGREPMADLRPGDWAQISVPIDEDPFLAVATSATSPDGPVTVLLARTLEPVAESTELVSGLLVVGVPLLIGVVGATTWLIVGLALAPVEAMRREVDEISAAELHRRVPAPRSSDEIGRLAQTMNRMLDRLEHAQATQRQLVADTSHELRSPIASIRQHAEVALAHPERSSSADLAATVHAEAVRLQRLVDDLLLLARVDERTLELAARAVDLDDLVFAEATRLRDADRLSVDTTAVSAGRVIGDEGGLRRVVANLAENAARHARSRVAFALSTQDEAIVLHVDDDGNGIPQADRQRVFDRFVRLDAARDRDAGGSGLGLAIVAELVAAHGGTVRVTDGTLGGARIEVRLPRGDAA